MVYIYQQISMAAKFVMVPIPERISSFQQWLIDEIVS